MTSSLIGVLALIGAPLFIHSSRFYMVNKTKVELQQGSRAVLSLVTKNLRQALSSTIVIDNLPGQPFYSRISFTKIDGGVASYSLNGTQISETFNGRASVLSKDGRCLNFYFPRSDDMTIVSVSLTLERILFEGRKKALQVASEKVRVMD